MRHLFFVPNGILPQDPIYPEPRYKKGTKFHRYKYGYTTPQFDGDPLVECVVGDKIWYDNKDGREWIYDATASEPVESTDNYWNRSMGFDTAVSEIELDKQHK